MVPPRGQKRAGHPTASLRYRLTKRETAYKIRRTLRGRSCWRERGIPRMEVRILGAAHVGDGTQRETETAARAESAARGRRFSGEHAGAAAADSGGIFASAGATEEARHRRHHRDVAAARRFCRRGRLFDT